MRLLVNIFEKALSSELFHTKASLSFPMVLENYFFSPIVTSFPLRFCREGDFSQSTYSNPLEIEDRLLSV